MTETRKRYKKSTKRGEKKERSSLCWISFATLALYKKIIKRTQKEKEEIRISSKYEST